MLTPKDFETEALDWLRVMTGHVPKGQEQKLAKILHDAYMRGRNEALTEKG